MNFDRCLKWTVLCICFLLFGDFSLKSVCLFLIPLDLLVMSPPPSEVSTINLGEYNVIITDRNDCQIHGSSAYVVINRNDP